MGAFTKLASELAKRVLALGGAAVLTLLFFLVLPLIQAIGDRPIADTALTRVDTAELEAPEAPPEPEIEEDEPEPEEPPPELAEEVEPLSLDQLEAAMNASAFGGGTMSADWGLDLGSQLQAAAAGDLAGMGEFDQKPRILMRPAPSFPSKLKKRAPATVRVKFIVDTNGRVQNPRVDTTTDPAFNRAALEAVRQWKFEPATHKGQPVAYPMRVPITFPKD